MPDTYFLLTPISCDTYFLTPISYFRDIVGRLGVADVKTFGLSWEDCNDFLKRLGYRVQVEVVATG